jgi:hypothetical protein
MQVSDLTQAISVGLQAIGQSNVVQKLAELAGAVTPEARPSPTAQTPQAARAAARQRAGTLEIADQKRRELVESQSGILIEQQPPLVLQALRELGCEKILGRTLLRRLDQIFAANALNHQQLREALNSLQQEAAQVFGRLDALQQNLRGLSTQSEKLEVEPQKAVMILVFQGQAAIHDFKDLSEAASSWSKLFNHLAKFGEGFRSDPVIISADRGSIRIWIGLNKPVIDTISGAVAALAGAVAAGVMMYEMVKKLDDVQFSEATKAGIKADIDAAYQKKIEDVVKVLEEHIETSLDEAEKNMARNSAQKIAEHLGEFILKGGGIEFTDPNSCLDENARQNALRAGEELRAVLAESDDVRKLLSSGSSTDNSNEGDPGE